MYAIRSQILLKQTLVAGLAEGQVFTVEFSIETEVLSSFEPSF
jgi:hypothetical protein